jgi:hypothetical protein
MKVVLDGNFVYYFELIYTQRDGKHRDTHKY